MDDPVTGPAALATLSSQQLIVGEIENAICNAQSALSLFTANISKSGPEGRDWQVRTLGILGHAQLQRGNRKQAEIHFKILNRQRTRQLRSGKVEALRMFQFYQQCDCLLSLFERASWCWIMGMDTHNPQLQPFWEKRISNVRKLCEEWTARAASFLRPRPIDPHTCAPGSLSPRPAPRRRVRRYRSRDRRCARIGRAC